MLNYTFQKLVFKNILFNYETLLINYLHEVIYKIFTLCTTIYQLDHLTSVNFIELGEIMSEAGAEENS